MKVYQSSDIAKRIKARAKQHGVSARKMLIDLGLGLNTMTNMKTSMPNADSVARMADYLDCSVDFLLGRTDNPEINR